MTATAGLLLLNSVMPMIQSAVLRGAITSVGSEDMEELVSEGCTIAARMLDSAEAKGKEVTAGNVAYYALQSLKAGRRSGYAGRKDALCPAAALDGAVHVRSMDEGIGCSEDDSGNETTLHDILSDGADDPSQTALRNCDWDSLMPALDDRQQMVVRESAGGMQCKELAGRLKITAPRVCQIKSEIGRKVRHVLGNDVLADATAAPAWRKQLRAVHEQRTCRRERSASHA